ncbi:recombinase family protein [Flavobacterium sp. N2038]|uniref:recombinase family protein n=1 Tax=Flavobacterium sp. N2038 TaxID=2986829 RepID=UPI002225AC2D|nr:recombinase family protein [Flavobacterium sp. N2038]
MNYVLYTRCSTNTQNISIVEQTQSAYKWLNSEDSIIEHFSEIESGRNNEREQLNKAIAYCQKNKATLLITRLDRLSRNASFTMALADSNIDFLALDCPNANKLTIGFMALMNQDYAEKVSVNTKKALAYLKSQGVKLGKPENFTKEVQKKGSIANKTKFENLNKQATKIILRLRGDKKTFEAIAIELNNDGYRTAQGYEFSKGTVKRLFDRVADKTES